MDINLYNTLSRKREAFRPVKAGEVKMYNCGPTVYDRVHIGNLRSYIFADTLRRMFEYNALTVTQVINITDVGHLVSDGDEGEDKMTKAIMREGKTLSMESMKEVATLYFEAFIKDLDLLNIEKPTAFPRASEHIAEDIEIISILHKKDIAYATSDGIYFDTKKFPAYGKLGAINLTGQKEGDRVAVNTEKRNSIDFALWKFDTKLGWESPWGKGFPGWHIECSAMSRKYLGQPFDVHTGGIDHIPTHHNNEIAQSEAAFEVPLANYWLHNEFLILDGGKMAKSAGGFITLETLREESISPLAYRYWLMTAHYRSPVNFTYEAVRAAQTALIRLITTVREYPEGGEVHQVSKEKFLAAINDDLDLPRAIALVWELLKDKSISEADKRATILDFDRVLGLDLKSVPPVEEEATPAEIIALAEAREEARAAKEWEKADALRVTIEERGFEVHDSAGGFKIVRK